MGSYDKLIRLAIAIVIIVLYYTGVLADIFGIAGLFLALYLTVTSLISYCPIYALFGMNSRKKDEN